MLTEAVRGEVVVAWSRDTSEPAFTRPNHGRPCHGYATEAAHAAFADGFERIGLEEIVSFTATVNLRSIKVMKRIGMTRDPADDFDHPRLPPGHRVRRHVLYRVSRSMALR